MDQDAHVIRKRAERARAAIAADVDAIGEKLNVRKQAVQKKDELVGKVKDRVGMSNDGEETRLGHEAHTVMDVVREHPMATLMAGAGGFGIQRIISAWREQHRPYPHAGTHDSDGTNGTTGYVAVESYPTLGATVITTEEYATTSEGEGGSMSDKVDGAKAKAHDVADTAKERVGDVTGTVKERASDVTGTVKERASGVGSRVSDMGSSAKERATGVTSTVQERMPHDRRELESSMRSNMTLWGAGAFALGAAIGSLIPSSRVERERLGEVRENVVDLAKEKADDAKQALEAGLDVAKEHAGEIVSDVKEHAQEAASEATDTAKDELKGSSESEDTGDTATMNRPGPILGSRDMETSTTDSVVPGGPIRPL